MDRIELFTLQLGADELAIVKHALRGLCYGTIGARANDNRINVLDQIFDVAGKSYDSLDPKLAPVR